MNKMMVSIRSKLLGETPQGGATAWGGARRASTCITGRGYRIAQGERSCMKGYGPGWAQLRQGLYIAQDTRILAAFIRCTCARRAVGARYSPGRCTRSRCIQGYSQGYATNQRACRAIAQGTRPAALGCRTAASSRQLPAPTAAPGRSSAPHPSTGRPSVIGCLRT
jgi:hypothetical protein